MTLRPPSTPRERTLATVARRAGYEVLGMLANGSMVARRDGRTWIGRGGVWWEGAGDVAMEAR